MIIENEKEPGPATGVATLFVANPLTFVRYIRTKVKGEGQAGGETLKRGTRIKPIRLTGTPFQRLTGSRLIRFSALARRVCSSVTICCTTC